jgi:hypothetical protein
VQKEEHLAGGLGLADIHLARSARLSHSRPGDSVTLREGLATRINFAEDHPHPFQ